MKMRKTMTAMATAIPFVLTACNQADDNASDKQAKSEKQKAEKTQSSDKQKPNKNEAHGQKGHQSAADQNAAGENNNQTVSGTDKNKKAQVNHEQTKSVNMKVVSYALGMRIANSFKKSGQTVDAHQFAKGLKQGMDGKKSKFSPEESQKIMQQFENQARKNIQNKKQSQYLDKVLKYQQAVYQHKNVPSIGPDKANVAVIEFFDYQCMFCSKLESAMHQIRQNNPNIKFIFKDFPVFGNRWPASNYAAKMGMKAYQQGGGKLYVKYHNDVFSTGKVEGDLTRNKINEIARNLDIQFKASQVKNSEMPKPIQSNIQLAMGKLGFQGTPIVVVMPTDNADKQNTTVFAGYPTDPKRGTEAAAKRIQEAIENAASN